jgi:hypothetical protein
MNYSIEILNAIEDYANLLELPEDIARILEVEPREFIDELKDVNSAVYKAFYKGYFTYELDLRKRNKTAIDIEAIENENQNLRDFKSKLIIQLEN